MPIQLPFYDDFTNIDPLVWTKVNQSGEVFDSNGSYLVANSSSSSFNYMTTNNLLSGDFDAVMEFETFTFQGSDSNIELILDDPDIALATLAIVRATTSEGSLFSTYYNGSFDSTNIKARNRISKSKIKLNRKGDLLSMYVADSFSSEFQLLVEVSNFITTDVRLRIRVRGNGAINANIYNLSIKPISNNLIQYNGQDILDVKYSDQNSVLQDVEMRLGSTVVWGGVETLYGLDFSKSSAQDRGVVIYSDTGNTKLTFRNDFKVIGRASFKA
ncbi:MAG: hypothetical protein GY829_10940, partial [Gammaproteobacteria bacterium]|nr:hypothetical protein [Gammaproteobacteria bacterium]